MPGRILPVRSNIRAERPSGSPWGRRRPKEGPGFMEVLGDITTVLGSPLTAPIAGALKGAFGDDPISPEEQENMKQWMHVGSAGTPSDAAMGRVDVPDPKGGPTAADRGINLPLPAGLPGGITGSIDTAFSDITGALGDPGAISQSLTGYGPDAQSPMMQDWPSLDPQPGVGVGLGGQPTPPMSLGAEFPEGYASFPESLSVGGAQMPSPMRRSRFGVQPGQRAPFAPIEPGMQTPIGPGAYQAGAGPMAPQLRDIAAQELGVKPAMPLGQFGLSPEETMASQIASGLWPEELLSDPDLSIPTPEGYALPEQPEVSVGPTPDPGILDKHKDLSPMDAAKAMLQEGAIQRAALDLSGIENWTPEQIAAAIPDMRPDQVPYATAWAMRNTSPKSFLDWIGGASDRETSKLLASKRPDKGISQASVVDLASKIAALRKGEAEKGLDLEEKRAGIDLLIERAGLTREQAEKIRQYRERKYGKVGSVNRAAVRRTASGILGLKSMAGATDEQRASLDALYYGLLVARPGKYSTGATDDQKLAAVRPYIAPPRGLSRKKRQSYIYKQTTTLLNLRDPKESKGWDALSKDQQKARENAIRDAQINAGHRGTVDSAQLAKEWTNSGRYSVNLNSIGSGSTEHESSWDALKPGDRRARKATIVKLLNAAGASPARISKAGELAQEASNSGTWATTVSGLRAEGKPPEPTYTEGRAKKARDTLSSLGGVDAASKIKVVHGNLHEVAASIGVSPSSTKNVQARLNALIRAARASAGKTSIDLKAQE